MLKVRPVGDRSSTALTVLRKHRIFGAATDTMLRDLLQRANQVSIPERDLLFRQGDDGKSVAVVLSGFVKLSALTGSGREVVLEICGPGSLFGEVAVLNGWPRGADALALSSAEVLAVPGDAFRAILARCPQAMDEAFKILGQRLRLATEQLMDGASLPGPARLAKALVKLVGRHGHPVGAGIRLDMALSQSELGAMTGLSRETINKQLAVWRDRSWIELAPRHITLLAAEALRETIQDAA